MSKGKSKKDGALAVAEGDASCYALAEIFQQLFDLKALASFYVDGSGREMLRVRVQDVQIYEIVEEEPAQAVARALERVRKTLQRVRA